MNTIVRYASWEGCRPFTNDDRRAIWASAYYAIGQHRAQDKPRIRVPLLDVVPENDAPDEDEAPKRYADIRGV